MKPTTVRVAATIGLYVAAATALVLGVIGPTLYWFVLWLGSTVTALYATRLNRQLLDALRPRVPVECSSCGARIGAPVDLAARTVDLPAGWRVDGGTPFCANCSPEGT